MFFLSLYVFVLTVMVPVFLVIQCVFPYLRVFTYMGSVLSMMFVLMPYALWAIVKPAADRLAQRRSFSLPAGFTAYGSLLAAAAAILLTVVYCRLPEYNACLLYTSLYLILNPFHIRNIFVRQLFLNRYTVSYTHLGQIWEIGLKRFGFPENVDITVHRLKRDMPVYLEQWPDLPEEGACRIHRLTAEAEYKLLF